MAPERYLAYGAKVTINANKNVIQEVEFINKVQCYMLIQPNDQIYF